MPTEVITPPKAWEVIRGDCIATLTRLAEEGLRFVGIELGERFAELLRERLSRVETERKFKETTDAVA